MIKVYFFEFYIYTMYIYKPMEKSIAIHTPFITLTQMLKLANLIDFGAQAKLFLKSTKVLVNTQEETRRGRKLYIGDVVEINNIKYLIKKENK